MTNWNKMLVAFLGVLVTAVAMAQEDPEDQEDNAPATEVQMREAEERLADAAARIAELSSRRLPVVANFERRVWNGNRVALGITIGSDDEDGPVEGVTIKGVSPGSAAAEAGLRTGDVITAVNDESLSAPKNSRANDKLLEFMAGVEAGDTLDIDYRRDGEDATVELTPRPMPGFEFGFSTNGGPPVAFAPVPPNVRWFGLYASGGSWGDMEMVSLTEELGQYFGTDTGLLVVRAPADESLKLQDGDVIQSIDGREPTSVSHAMRILGSYQGGEKLDIEIMRNKERQTISIEMPDHRRGQMSQFHFAAPQVERRSDVILKSRPESQRDRI